MGHLSFHAGVEGKIKRKDIKGIIGHTFRKTEKRFENHGNKEIDKSKTKYSGDWTSRKNKSLDEIVEDRIENEFRGKRALRKDAVVLREIIAQPSADMFEGMTIEEKRKKAVEFTNDSLPWFRKEFGEKNVVGLSVHMDETNPHVHFAIMPMTSDGRLSQKDFFKGPADLKRQHREYREHMISHGWDFDTENKYVDASKEPLDVYKRVGKKLEAKRLEHKEIMQELANERLNDDVIEDLAVRMLLDDSGESLKEKLELEREELRRKKEKFEQEVKIKEQELKNTEKTAKERGFKKGVQEGVNAGLSRVGELLHDKMKGNGYVRDVIFKAFDNGRFKPMVNAWDKQGQIKKKEREAQQSLVNDIVTTQVDELEL